jgi:DNA-directed RNA polymerase specialized sigma24 family protein
MMTASYCNCLICRLEEGLIAELSDDRSQEEFRLLSISSTIVSAFPTASELVRKLRDHDNNDQNPSSDEVLLDLLGRSNDVTFGSLWQRLLLLVFIPTIHRTTTQITGTFPSLTRDDTAQHLFAVLLEYLHSQELRSRQSHLGFTIARKVRRSAFRWAIRESRTSLLDETRSASTEAVKTDASDDDSHASILLGQFLDNCQRKGWLSTEERQLLIEFKLEGISGPELARRNGHSVVAIRHRIQRLLDRLRRIAQSSGSGMPQQLNLFLP